MGQCATRPEAGARPHLRRKSIPPRVPSLTFLPLAPQAAAGVQGQRDSAIDQGRRRKPENRLDQLRTMTDRGRLGLDRGGAGRHRHLRVGQRRPRDRGQGRGDQNGKAHSVPELTRWHKPHEIVAAMGCCACGLLSWFCGFLILRMSFARNRGHFREICCSGCNLVLARAVRGSTYRCYLARRACSAALSIFSSKLEISV